MNSTATPLPAGCESVPSREVAARNAVRAADAAFNITGVSAPTGLHYSWTWRASPACAVHFVHMNLFGGRAGCGSAGTPGKEGTYPCTDSWIWPEDSLGFLEADLAAHAGPGVLVVTLQHYGFDGWSNTWYNADQRVDMWRVLSKYNTLAAFVGHTHSAMAYSFNGTDGGDFGSTAPGFIDVVNAPATQKEDGQFNALPSEFMAAELALDATGKAGTFRVAQRVGSGWGKIQASKKVTC